MDELVTVLQLENFGNLIREHVNERTEGIGTGISEEQVQEIATNAINEVASNFALKSDIPVIPDIQTIIDDAVDAIKQHITEHVSGGGEHNLRPMTDDEVDEIINKVFST